MARVFLCYRREDSGAHAGRVKDWLERDLGADVLFMDVDNIPIGRNFVKILSEEVAKCEVLLAFIGRDWLDVQDEDGNRRLDNPQDFVRIEIASALQRDIPVVPILLDGAKIPSANHLPKELKELSFRNGIDLRLSSFKSDVDRLRQGLKEELRADPGTAEIKSPKQTQEERPKQVEAKLKPALAADPVEVAEQAPPIGIIAPVPIEDLRPTQMTVGMREVDIMCKRFRTQKPKKIGKYLGGHMIPVVYGPKQRYYIIDHHHLSLALHKVGMEQVLVTVILDLRQLELDAFWVFLDHRGWVYPYDPDGHRRDFSDLPKSVTGLKDDPFRSLAGELRRAGGFAKETAPFSEFLWADFLRRRLKANVVQTDFEAALEKALHLAKSTQAQYLPGWCGPLALTR